MNEENNIDTRGYNFDPETGERIVRSEAAEMNSPAPSPEPAAAPHETARPAAPVYRDLPDASKRKKKGGFFKVLALILC